MSTNKKSAFAACCSLVMVAAALPAGAQGASAPVENYPNRPLRMLVGLPSGGSVDAIGRIVAAKLGEALGQNVVVENRAGAAGLIASETAAHATPDGYTLLFGASFYSEVFTSAQRKLPYDPIGDFAPISLVTKVPNVLVIYPGLPTRSVSELLAYAKANPGKLNFASSGNGSSAHLSMELLRKQAGVEIVHVPYKGLPQALPDLLEGRVQAMFGNLPGQIANIKNAKVRALAITSAKRHPGLPDLPTMIEAGVPGYEITVWYGMFAPARTPAAILTRLNAELVKVLRSDDVRRRFAEQGAEPAPTSRAEFAAFQNAESAKWTQIVKESGAANR